MQYLLSFLPVTCTDLEFHFQLPLSEDLCYRCAKFVLHFGSLFICIAVLFERTREDHGENKNMRSYSDVASGSGKFIFAVSARYLCGAYCNCLGAILPNHAQSFISLRVIGLRVQVSSLLTILVFVTFCE